MKDFSTSVLIVIIINCIAAGQLCAQPVHIVNNKGNKQITFSNKKIKAVLDYNQKLNLSSFVINGQPVITGDSGVYSMIKTKDQLFSTLALLQSPLVEVAGNTIQIKKIMYGNKENSIEENWTITVTADSIQLGIKRKLSKDLAVEKAGLPVFNFKSIYTWEGAYQDYGGLAWFYLFNKPLDTYGVHSKSSRFWNTKTGQGLVINVAVKDAQTAMDYVRTVSGKLAFSIDVAPSELIPRFDSGTYRRRFIRDTTAWIWSSFVMPKGETTSSVTIACLDVEKEFDRGKLTGIDQQQVSAVLNTIARIGVIDKQHFGGNSWHTPYGPICLHEQYIAQLGLAINDPAYITGYRDCLDFYRDHAIKPDGRVWARWAYTNEDAMPGEVNDKGFYEAQWGFLMDSNPDYVTNVAELYDQNGDLDWVRTHQQSCEQALNWILKRDSNHNGLVEMMTDSTAQKRGSDWIDIIWAAYENAFVNAKLYHALVVWADIEKQLGNTSKGDYYKACAAKLKASFNKSTAQGGFWDEENNCYIHWRDKDGALHGRNMVIPVNFMAIGYDICTDEARKKLILDKIETQMQQEHLFFWPLCLYSYAPGEGNDWQFPFPNYENGDIFLSWGALGVKVYASYKPGLAIKYVQNVLNQYAKDGLAFQRYGRLKQDGLGDDILSGNSLSIVGLYQAVYGINPKYNRFYLDPHLMPALNGTELNYKYRNKSLHLTLKMDQYTISDGRFSVSSTSHFGFFSNNDTLLFFKAAEERASLQAIAGAGNHLAIQVKNRAAGENAWQQSAAKKPYTVHYRLNNVAASKNYSVYLNNKLFKNVRSDAGGTLLFNCPVSAKPSDILVKPE